MDDRALLAAYLDRADQRAFAELVQRHARMVVGVCRRVVGETAGAEDAAQATFIALADKAPGLRTHPALGGWLHRVATHIALRLRDSERARRRHEGAAPAGAPQEPGLREDLDEALARLPERYRTPIVMHHLEGEEAGAVAARLGLRSSALSMRLARGRELLRRALGEPETAVVAVLAVCGTPSSSDAAAASELGAHASELTAGLGSSSSRSALLARSTLRRLALARMVQVAGVACAGMLAVAGGFALKAMWFPLLPPPNPIAPTLLPPPHRNTSVTWTPCRFVRRELLTPDIAASRRFYEALFGWNVRSEPAAENVPNPPYQRIQNGGDDLGAYVESPRLPQARWRSFLSVDDVDATYRAALAAGASSAGAPSDQLSPDQPTMDRSAIVVDPGGAEFALWHGASGDPPAGGPVAAGSWVWSELLTTKAEPVLAFYGRVFGFTSSPTSEPEGTYHLLVYRGEPRAGVLEFTGDAMKPSWVPYVKVADVDATLKRARELGATTDMTPLDVPGAGRLVILTDPQGATFYVMTPRPR